MHAGGAAQRRIVVLAGSIVTATSPSASSSRPSSAWTARAATTPATGTATAIPSARSSWSATTGASAATTAPSRAGSPRAPPGAAHPRRLRRGRRLPFDADGILDQEQPDEGPPPPGDLVNLSDLFLLTVQRSATHTEYSGPFDPPLEVWIAVPAFALEIPNEELKALFANGTEWTSMPYLGEIAADGTPPSLPGGEDDGYYIVRFDDNSRYIVVLSTHLTTFAVFRDPPDPPPPAAAAGAAAGADDADPAGDRQGPAGLHGPVEPAGEEEQVQGPVRRPGHRRPPVCRQGARRDRQVSASASCASSGRAPRRWRTTRRS